jgi:hypothetical protein
MGKKNKINIIDTDNILNFSNYNIKEQTAPDEALSNNELNNNIKIGQDNISDLKDDKLAEHDNNILSSSSNTVDDLINANNSCKVKNKDVLDTPDMPNKLDKIVKPSTDIIKELLTNQLKNVNISKRLNYNDIKRISKFLTSSIFDPDKCSLWTGYITNEKNQSKGTYINFYFNQKKIALHRLLYLNFIGDIINTEYLKFSCVNKGKCCNIHHLKKYSYNSLIPNNPTNKPNLIDNTVHINRDKESLSLEL